jgi:biopolymer transport protein ExbD
MRFSTHKRRRPPSVIIVSLIDVLLVVLIFLMVTTTAKKQEPALQLNLPQSKEAKQGATEAKPFVILISTNFPYFYVGNRPVTLDNLQKELVAAAKKDPQVKVAVRADRSAPWGEVVKVIDLTKVAQVGGINFVTERPAGAVK